MKEKTSKKCDNSRKHSEFWLREKSKSLLKPCAGFYPHNKVYTFVFEMSGFFKT